MGLSCDHRPYIRVQVLKRSPGQFWLRKTHLCTQTHTVLIFPFPQSIIEIHTFRTSQNSYMS